MSMLDCDVGCVAVVVAGAELNSNAGVMLVLELDTCASAACCLLLAAGDC